MNAPGAAANGAAAYHGGRDVTRLGDLLDDLVARVPGIRHALVLSAEGLPRGASQALGREDGEQLAAVASGFLSLARGVSRHFVTGGVRQTVVELDDAFLVVSAAGAGSCLAVFAETDADLGQIGYEMTMLVRRGGPLLGEAPHGSAPSGDGTST